MFDAKNASRGEFSFPVLPKRATDESVFEYEQLGRVKNLQCIYTFVARPGQRVKLDFDQFQLAGTADNCELEYVDIYSELERVQADLLSASLSGRYCGSVSPHIRISLHNVLVLVFHSRAGESARRQLRFKGRYSFINEDKYIPGAAIPGQKCGYVIDPNNNPKLKKRNYIISPTYPGTYPKNFHCAYHLKGRAGQRIRLLFHDFDLYFGGEHCPYDTLTVFDGPSTNSPIVRKVCGLQQRMEVFSVGPDFLLHFNTSNPSKADPRGFVIEYEFSSNFVDIEQLLRGEPGVTHMRGTQCDVRVESNRETTHYIHSPLYPNLYPANTTCTYILDGLQGDQNLEKVILTFEELAVISDTSDNPVTAAALAEEAGEELQCPHAWIGVAHSDANMRATLSSNDESNFDATLCERIPKGSPAMGPYVSEGPRMVVQFGTSAHTPTDGLRPLGFRTRIDFKTDFGVPGEPMADSNQCLFRFTQPRGFFNSPRYPANYPLDTNCTYYIIAQPGEQILIHFEQFILSEEETKQKTCNDWLAIFDVFKEKDGGERLELQARYCAGTFPGPRVTSFGAHEIRVVFSSDSYGSGNGFKALYEIRRAPGNDISENVDESICGQRFVAGEHKPTGRFASPGYPTKYSKDVHCEWEVVARENHQILLKLGEIDIEGKMVDIDTPSCQKAVIRVTTNETYEFCGQGAHNVKSVILSTGRTARISFLSAPDKVNGLKGFYFNWTEVRFANEQSCPSDSHYLCTYSKLCISSQLRCNEANNCGTPDVHDDSDETHCLQRENSADKTLVLAIVVCGVIFCFICFFFCYLFKMKLVKKKKNQGPPPGSRLRPRHPPYRQPKQVKHRSDNTGMALASASRFVHHDATGLVPPTPFPSVFASTSGTGTLTSHRSVVPEDSSDLHTFYG